MPLPVVANTVRCSVIYDGPNGEAVNALHFQEVGGGSEDIADLAATMDDQWWANLRARVSSQWTITGYNILPLDGTSAGTFFPYGGSASAAGGQTGAPLPPEVSRCFTLYTAERGRSGRGRFYLPGGDASHVTTPPWQWTTADTAAAQTNIDTILTAFDTDPNWAWVIVGLNNSGVPSPKLVVRTTCRQAIRTQRRRLTEP